MVRYATADDLRKYFPDGKIPFSCRAVAVEKDGEVLGVGGVYWDNGCYIAFSHIDEALKKDRRSIIEACRMAMDIVKSLGVTVFAVPNEDEPTCDSFIAHFGFTKEKGYYTWRSWQQQPHT